ncbi:MAG: cytochrome c/FTR1 family iron permease [Polaromonas sp.]|uniref:cytochrome c/FTR1 family iron permease n=1 Tax=Polaromonas sp. TaxID=1869339 RepID=UPI0025FFD4B5|nr:cytochrome c/FTR1 family iron permease [Polaromonas sp.]MBI2728509.1 cytochrome c/FTR1 family iron permease [Polaromonas sp.]
MYPQSLSKAFWACLTFAACFFAGPWAQAQDLAVQNQAKQIWQLLDYIAVDYGKAVKDGKAVSESEYKEMQEFAQAAETQLAELPAVPAKPELLKNAATLKASIASKAASPTVSDLAHSLSSSLLLSYPVPMSPAKLPDLQQGAQLYQSQCAACHGVSGHADGPLASKLSPPPIALSDHDRARERSVFALQQIITQGVKGTSMRSFTELSDDERWNIAYFASTLSYTDRDRQEGARLWSSRPELRAAIPTLSKLSESSEVALAKTVGADNARQMTAYLRSTPDSLSAQSAESLVIAKDKLKASLIAMDKGDTPAALRLALSAYLDGFEPVEPALAAKNRPLFEDIEKNMGAFRNAVSAGQVAQARAIEKRLQVLLTDGQSALGAANDPLSTYLGALTILLREGLEALLVVVAILAFLKKADRADVLPYVHAGWISALAAGGLTWGIATYLVELSGASREMTEGFSAIFASVVLLAVGVWMHQKSMAGRWQAYVKQKLSSALNRKSAMMLFLLSFITVYREVFETVLFYAALWTQDNGIYLLAGLGSGLVILGGVAWLLLRSSAKLPISQFFVYSSALVGVLAVVLMGKGVAALQKVGLLENTPVLIPRIDALGVYPSLQTLGAQVLILLIILVSVGYNLRLQKNTVRQ